jgi:hypothetical protein
MRKAVLSSIIASFLTAVCCGQPNGTAMLYLPLKDSPAVLTEHVHGPTDFLESAKLKNVSDHSITGFRIGWVVVYPSGKSKVGLGSRVDVPEGITPGTVVDVPAQQVSPNFAQEGASAIVFFVTDIRSRDVPVWKPEIESVEKLVLDEVEKAAALPAQ